MPRIDQSTLEANLTDVHVPTLSLSFHATQKSNKNSINTIQRLNSVLRHLVFITIRNGSLMATLQFVGLLLFILSSSSWQSFMSYVLSRVYTASLQDSSVRKPSMTNTHFALYSSLYSSTSHRLANYPATSLNKRDSPSSRSLPIPAPARPPLPKRPLPQTLANASRPRSAD